MNLTSTLYSPGSEKGEAHVEGLQSGGERKGCSQVGRGRAAVRWGEEGLQSGGERKGCSQVGRGRAAVRWGEEGLQSGGERKGCSQVGKGRGFIQEVIRMRM